MPVHGVLLLDKPVDLSSNDALIKAKRLLNAQKAGHTGTLDPFATGLLPLCFGEATKFSQDLLNADKTYEAVVHLGIRTTTGDTEGEVIETRAVNVTRQQIDAVLAQFRGDIAQIPPMHSALKRGGKPLYEYARAGVTVEREARQVTIHALELLDCQASQASQASQIFSPYLHLRITCSKGTYIRVLAENIGAALDCCAHLQALRRTQVGSLILDNAVTLDALAAMEEKTRTQQLAPVDALLSDFPAIYLPEELARRFLHGQRLALGKEEGATLPPFKFTKGRVRVHRIDNGHLLGVAQLSEFSVLVPERLIAVNQCIEAC